MFGKYAALRKLYCVFFYFNSKVCPGEIFKIYYSFVRHNSMKFHLANEYKSLRFCRRNFILAVLILDSKLNFMTEVVFAICIKTMMMLAGLIPVHCEQ